MVTRYYSFKQKKKESMKTENKLKREIDKERKKISSDTEKEEF